MSIICSDQTLPMDHLQRLKEDLVWQYSQGKQYKFNLDSGSITYLGRMFADPAWRDPFTLRKLAKSGFFAKRMNWHFEGPDGYHVEVVKRGKEISRQDFDALLLRVGTDAFYIETYENGKKSAALVQKDLWYCLKDLNAFQERSSSDKYSGICRQMAIFTLSYIKGKHGIDMFSEFFAT